MNVSLQLHRPLTVLTLMTRKIMFVLCIATTIVMLFSSTAVAQDYRDVCKDPVDDGLFMCLKGISDYTNWMVVTNSNATPGKLQQAIDELYKNVQEDWTGPLRKQRYMRLFYVLVPFSLLVYYLWLMLLQRLKPPRFPPGKPASWGAEKAAIIGGAIALIATLFGERFVTHYEMVKTYDLLPKAVEPFVHVRAPGELVSYTEKPCDLVFEEDNILLTRCKQDWARGPAREKSQLVTSGFTDPELIRNLIAIGKACQGIRELPSWFTNRGGTFEVKMDCSLSAQTPGGVTVGNLQGLFNDLTTWIAQGRPLLRLENAFGVGSITGESVYRTKVQSLIGRDEYRKYREEFERKSAMWLGLGIICFLVSAALIYLCRKRQLEGGSEDHGKWLERILKGGTAVSFLVCLVVVIVLLA